MGLKKAINKVKKEAKALVGKESKDVTCTSEQPYSSQQEGLAALEKAKLKLFDINRWSDLPGFDSIFLLHDTEGRKSEATKPAAGWYINIILPGPFPPNWVIIDHVQEEALFAEIKVSPCPSPLKEDKEATDHFFTQEASNTFRVELQGTTLVAMELGRDETINNRGKEAGDRTIVNTIVAEGGWMGVNRIQWDKIVDYFVHKIEIKQT
jgi:hypothetical protein